MLELELPDNELYDETNNVFVTIKGGTFRFEHSLKAIRLWESLYKKPFLGKEHTLAELKVYYQLMSIDKKLPLELIDDKLHSALANYIDDSHTATRIQNGSGGRRKRIITAEIIYAMMAMAQVPFTCEEWHINNLLMVLQIIGIESDPKGKKKQPINEVYKSNTALNEARRKQYGTKG